MKFSPEQIKSLNDLQHTINGVDPTALKKAISLFTDVRWYDPHGPERNREVATNCLQQAGFNDHDIQDLVPHFAAIADQS